MNAHKLEAVLSEDGRLTLDGLPFQAGEVVEVIVLANAAFKAKTNGTSVCFPQSSGSTDQISSESSGQEYFASISDMMEEWESEADEAAYQNL
jgi:hypothetical protein